jgi:hypothetical protein
MALLAGLALLTRVSTGLGLHAATGLLIVGTHHRCCRWERIWERPQLGWPPANHHPIAAIPGTHRDSGLVATGLVNFFRWGSPTTFADYSLYLMNDGLDLLSRMHTYGLFNIARIPFSLGYFFAPIWMFEGADGKLLFEAEQTRLFYASAMARRCPASASSALLRLLPAGAPHPSIPSRSMPRTSA